MNQKRKRTKNPRIRSDGYAKDVVYSLDIDCIRANSSQPRRDFDVDSIIKLADSIRRYGILQPLTVRRAAANEGGEKSKRKRNLVADVLSIGFAEELSRPLDETNDKPTAWDGVYVSRETSGEKQLCIPDVVPLLGSTLEEVCEQRMKEGAEILSSAAYSGDFGTNNCPLQQKTAPLSVFVPADTCQYELVAGERRLRAARMLGLREVPCIIVDVDDALSAELALVENMLRENLNMFEQAEAFSHLSQKYSLTQEEIAAKMSLSQSAVANKIRLLRLSEGEREQIMEAGLTERHARALLRVTDAALREECLRVIIERKWNVSDADKYISSVLERGSEAEKAAEEMPSPDKLCANIYRFINRMQTASGNYLIVNRRSDDKNVVITLTVRKGS